MSFAVERSDEFRADFTQQFTWYLIEAGEEVARRFEAEMESTLDRVALNPEFGPLCRFRHPILQGLRWVSVGRRFHAILIFYRVQRNSVQAWRLMHGSRDLSKRLLDPPHRFD